MQTTLLGIALALITAILAAFAAPLFIDWNEWRPQLEAQASALAGTRVTISGNIDLTILPTPAFVLREVSLGDADSGTGLRANEMRGSLSLTALLSGKIEASEFVLSRPAIRLVIDKDGHLLLPAGANAGQEISVSGFVLEAGSITVEDRRTNSLFAADDFSARGELVSREGPFRLDGGFRLNGARWIVRASSGRFGPDHSGKARIALERPADGVTFEAEGSLALSNALPRFDGKISFARQGGTLPWRLTADAAGDLSELRFANLEVALGQGELPLTLSGEAKLAPYAKGTLEASLSSKRIDLDLGNQNAGAAGAASVLPLLSDARALFASLPLPSKISLSADGVVAGGQLSRDLRVELRAQNGAVTLERLEARLPGRAVIALSGKNEGERFSGPLAFEAEDPQNFARWLLGTENADKYSFTDSLRVKSDLVIAPESISILNLDAVFGSARVNGEIALLTEKAELKLALRNAEIDALFPAFQNLRGIIGTNILLDLSATDIRFHGMPVKQAALKLKQTGDTLALERLEVADFDGLSLAAKDAGGAIEYSAEIMRSGGFTALMNYLSGSSDLASLTGRYAAPYYPLRLSGTLAREKGGWRLLVKSGEAALTLEMEARKDSRLPVQATLRLPETEIAAKGELRFGAQGRIEPALALTFKSTDLRKAFVLADRASAEPLNLSGAARLIRDSDNFVFDAIVFELAGSRGSGRIAFPVGEVSSYSGKVALDRASGAALISLGLGRTSDAAALSAPVLAGFPGNLRFEIGTLDLPGKLALQKVEFDLRVGRYETVYDNFRGLLAGGNISGSLRLADAATRVAELKLQLAEVSLEQLLGTPAIKGRLRASLALSASGNTRDSLLASSAGQGTIALTSLEIDRVDATAVSTVFAATAQEAPDEKRVEQLLLAALDRQSLKVSLMEAPLVVANGVIRSGSAKAQAGNIEIALSGSLNLSKRAFEILLAIEVTGKQAAKPGALVRWSGPLDASERSVDAKALLAAIALRAIERGGVTPQPDERVTPSKKKRQPAAKSEIETVPLPPPAVIPSAPQPRSQN